MHAPVNRPERGATASEYVLLITVIAVIIVGAMLAFGVAVSELFTALCPRADAVDAYCP